MTELEDLEAARTDCLERILTSESSRQIIVAGAGTGKTFTFKQLLERVSGDSLAITFINALAKDMAEELEGLADTRTFHSFCRKILHKVESDGITADFHLFPKLEQLVVLDASAFGFASSVEKDNFSTAFRALVEDDDRIEFYLERAGFYNAVGFDDCVYRVLRVFRDANEAVPKFDQVVVDEYQDFNPLEVEFIDHLASKSPILIAGDDDQAIYDFKAASPDYLREKVKDPSFETHELPYCSRCTSVIVQACNDFVGAALANGFLRGRVDKQYQCYEPGKRADNDKYPQLVHASCSVNMKKAPYIGRYIEQVVKSISEEEAEASIKGRYPLALIMGPSHYLTQIHNYLVGCFENVVYMRRPRDDLTLLDGYRVLLADDQANLGWRVVTQLEEPDLARQLVLSSVEDGNSLYSGLEQKFLDRHLACIESLRALMRGDEIGNDAIQTLEKRLSVPLDEIKMELKIDIENVVDGLEGGTNEQDGKPEIRLTTYNGSKGMSAGFTFVVGLENEVLPKSPEKIVDNEICQFVVALTRTRQQCHLISTGIFAGVKRAQSEFLNWIPTDYVKRIRVDKNYF